MSGGAFSLFRAIVSHDRCGSRRNGSIVTCVRLARRGMTREQWVKRGEAGRVTFGELVSRSRAGALVTARVAGTGHFSFSDAPFVMPSAITRFGGRIIQPTRGWNVITSVLRTYFESELRGRGDGLAAVAARFGELTVERK